MEKSSCWMDNFPPRELDETLWICYLFSHCQLPRWARKFHGRKLLAEFLIRSSLPSSVEIWLNHCSSIMRRQKLCRVIAARVKSAPLVSLPAPCLLNVSWFNNINLIWFQFVITFSPSALCYCIQRRRLAWTSAIIGCKIYCQLLMGSFLCLITNCTTCTSAEKALNPREISETFESNFR